MVEIQLKNRLGFYIILSHFLIIFIVVILYILGGFFFEEMTTTLALIVPMFAMYTTAIVKYIITNRGNQSFANSGYVNTPFVVLSFLIPSIFILFIILLIFFKAFNLGFSTFEQFKILLLFGETMFGAYVGFIMSSLFEIAHKNPDAIILSDVEKSLNFLRKQLQTSSITEDEFFITLSDIIEKKFRRIDLHHIRRRLIIEYPYLQEFLVDSETFGKYQSFLLNAEYLYQESLSGKISVNDGAVIIVEYAKIVDAILQEYAGKPIGKERCMLGQWKEIVENEKSKTRLLAYFSQDQDLCLFFTSELLQHIDNIKHLRNSSAHGMIYELTEVKRFRDYLFIQQSDCQKSLIEWCIKLVDYSN